MVICRHAINGLKDQQRSLSVNNNEHNFSLPLISTIHRHEPTDDIFLS
jgi:hypothetical protein